MKNLNEIELKELRNIKGILTDFDDTFTVNRRLNWKVLKGVEELKVRGYRVVIVTGRPAGWCDCMLRILPIDGIVGENGALYFYRDSLNNVKHRLLLTEEELRRNRRKLEGIKRMILKEIPECRVAMDQFSRINDLAIDFAEDFSVPLSYDKVYRIYKIFLDNGANAKISSIHVNGWFGNFNKLSTFLLMAKEVWNEEESYVKEKYIYIGDSPNDQEMFKFFKFSVGVGNLKKFLPFLREEELPTFITVGREGFGFLEVVKLLLKSTEEENKRCQK